ncbi:IS30 family transposase, partial [Zooshikella ganghwensis]
EGLEADIYFANPYASWERGTNENTNGLIRQYFPKDTDFNKVSDEDIQFVMDRLNERPRATRNFKSPNEMFLGWRVDLLAN